MAEEKIDDILKEYDEGAKTALICEDNQEAQKAISAGLRELKYAVDTAPNTDEAFDKIKFNHYDVVVISESFAGSTPDNNEFLGHIQKMPMSARRTTFFALFGKKFTTMDNMQAFEKSVHVVVNESDLPNSKAVFKKAIAANDQFYKVYRESMAKIGKM